VSRHKVDDRILVRIGGRDHSGTVVRYVSDVNRYKLHLDFNDSIVFTKPNLIKKLPLAENDEVNTVKFMPGELIEYYDVYGDWREVTYSHILPNGRALLRNKDNTFSRGLNMLRKKKICTLSAENPNVTFKNREKKSTMVEVDGFTMLGPDNTSK